MAPSAVPKPLEPTPQVRLRYLVFGRIVPCFLYAFLGYIIVIRTINSYRDLGPNPSLFTIAAGPVRSTLYLAFVLMPIAIYLTRPLPRARDSTVGAWVAALVGTTMLLFVGAFAPAGPLVWTSPDWLVDAADLVLAAATALGLYGLAYLRHSFSIVPEARRLVRGGPYALVRHPLYLAEILVALALVVATGPAPYGPHLVPLLAWAAFVGVQLWRISYEERLLRAMFPDDYAEFAATTARLIPWVW